jgi:hypothetical protein
MLWKVARSCGKIQRAAQKLELNRLPMTITGIVQNGQIVLEPGISLPEGTRVNIVVPPAEQRPTLSERLLKHAGTVTDLPADMAEQHDHYIHGTPKH